MSNQTFKIKMNSLFILRSKFSLSIMFVLFVFILLVKNSLVINCQTTALKETNSTLSSNLNNLTLSTIPIVNSSNVDSTKERITSSNYESIISTTVSSNVVTNSELSDNYETSSTSTNDNNNNEEEETEAEDEDDPWADVEDEDDPSSPKTNIVDQMRALQEKDLTYPYKLTTSHLNETIDKVINAWNIIDQYYLPSRETWEKLLGLVTGLDVNVQPECFASYFQGVSGFRSYQAWAYRCKYYTLKFILYLANTFFLLVLDVRGRFPETGTLHGKFSSFGEWDECLELESPENSNTGLVVKSQYCMLEVKVPYPEVNNYEQLKQVVEYDHPWFKSVKKFLQNYRLHNLFTPYKLLELLQMTNGTIYRAGLCMPYLCKHEEIENLLINCK